MENKMEKATKIGIKVQQAQRSLDDLKSTVYHVEHSDDSLNRLNQALKDINEEVNLLRNIIQLNVNAN